MLLQTLNEINALCKLEDDWDMEGAPAISRDSLAKATAFIKSLEAGLRRSGASGEAPSVYPTVNGGVQLFWRMAEGVCSITFEPYLSDSEIEVVSLRRGERPEVQALNAEDSRNFVIAFTQSELQPVL